MRFDKKVKGLSLGQGQGLKATKLIEEASQKGTWVSPRNSPEGSLRVLFVRNIVVNACGTRIGAEDVLLVYSRGLRPPFISSQPRGLE